LLVSFAVWCSLNGKIHCPQLTGRLFQYLYLNMEAAQHAKVALNSDNYED